MGVPVVHSLMSENIMAEKQQKKMLTEKKHWQRHIHWDGKYAVNIKRWQTLSRIFPNKFSVPFEWRHTTDVVLHNVEPFSF